MSIEVSHVSYTYMPGTPLSRQALDDVSAVIPEGSVTAVAGHTGSGKSTFIQHLNGLLKPYTGKVFVDGTDLGDRSKKGKRALVQARRKVGMVFQYPEQQLFEETVAKDIAFGPRSLGLGESEIDERVKRAMDAVGLAYDEFADKPPFRLSGGQMRRVAIAGVLALEPAYLVLDEPTAGLDPRSREELLQQMMRLHRKQHTAIIFVSHHMDDILRLADTMLLFRDGKIAAKGAPREVFMQTELLKECGLRPPRIMELSSELCRAGYLSQMVYTEKELVDVLGRRLRDAR